MTNTDKARQVLLRLRDDYTQRHTALNKDLHHEESPVEKDFAEQATQMENEQVLHALDDEAKILLNHINLALKRIQDGEYGICTDCGEQIANDRLNALPYTPTCVSCASKKEQQ